MSARQDRAVRKNEIMLTPQLDDVDFILLPSKLIAFLAMNLCKELGQIPKDVGHVAAYAQLEHLTVSEAVALSNRYLEIDRKGCISIKGWKSKWFN